MREEASRRETPEVTTFSHPDCHRRPWLRTRSAVTSLALAMACRAGPCPGRGQATRPLAGLASACGLGPLRQPYRRSGIATLVCTGAAHPALKVFE